MNSGGGSERSRSSLVEFKDIAMSVYKGGKIVRVYSVREIIGYACLRCKYVMQCPDCGFLKCTFSLLLREIPCGHFRADVSSGTSE